MDLSFSFDINFKPSKTMPKDLQETLSNYMENEGTEGIAKEVRNLISKYCIDNNLPDYVKNSPGKKVVLKLDPEKDKESQIDEFFSQLGKKRSMEMKKSLSNDGVEDLKEEINALTESINPDSTDEEKSMCAFKILDLKLKFEAARYESSLQTTTEEVVGKIEEFKRLRPNDTSVDVLAVEKEFSRISNVTKQTTSELRRLNSLDEKDFKDLDYESRGKYLQHVKSELDKAEGFLEEELNSIRKKLVIVLTKKLGLGEHMSYVLG